MTRYRSQVAVGLLPLLWSGSATGSALRNATEDEGDKESKMAAVNKVIEMLHSLDAEVHAEGEKEAATYNKFACFCKDTTTEKTDAIQEGEDAKLAISAKIGELQGRRDELDTEMSDREVEIEGYEQEMKEAKEQRAEEHKLYVKNEADLAGGVSALQNALKMLKGSKKPSLIQMQGVSRTVRLAATMADALGLGGAKAQRTLALFLQQSPDVPMEDFKFHSDDIISTLEGLLDDFRSSKNDVDKEEVAAQATHDSFMQEKTDAIKVAQKQLNDATEERSLRVEQIATESQELSVVAAKVLDDQQYLMELSRMCHEKAKTWDQRSEVRANELGAINAALVILEGAVSNHTSAATVRFAQVHPASVRLAKAVARSPAAMEALEAEAEAEEAGPLAFLQRARAPRHKAAALTSVKQHVSVASAAARTTGLGVDGRQEVINLLKTQGQQLRSTMLENLASRLSADPLAKVKTLIQELIERLLKQAQNEGNQKGWCDKSMGDAAQQRNYAAEDIAELNAHMAELEALRDKLGEELGVLADEIGELTESMSKAERDRAAEKAENAATVDEAHAGVGAVSEAIDILMKFYGTAANSEVALLAKKGHRGPAEDAPETFDEGEANHGSQGAAEGIQGMLEVIKSDFERTVDETEHAEQEAYQAHLEFMTESGKSKAEKEMAQGEFTKQRDDAIDKLNQDNDDLDSRVALLKAKIQELLQLHDTCVDTGMSYEERVAKREAEIESLKKAECILESFATYGPDGGVSGC